jgi:hypothetical protein
MPALGQEKEALKMRIPTKSPTDSDLKPPGIPI